MKKKPNLDNLHSQRSHLTERHSATPPLPPVDVVTWINPRCYLLRAPFFVSILVSVQFCVASLLIRRTHRPFRGFKGALIV